MFPEHSISHVRDSTSSIRRPECQDIQSANERSTAAHSNRLPYNENDSGYTFLCPETCTVGARRFPFVTNRLSSPVHSVQIRTISSGHQNKPKVGPNELKTISLTTSDSLPDKRVLLPYFIGTLCFSSNFLRSRTCTINTIRILAQNLPTSNMQDRLQMGTVRRLYPNFILLAARLCNVQPPLRNRSGDHSSDSERRPQW